MSSRRAPFLSILLGALCVSTAAHAEDSFDEPPPSVPMVIPDFSKPQPVAPLVPRGWEPPTKHRWEWWTLTAVRNNPIGLTMRFNTGYRMQLFERPGLLFEQSHIAAKIAGEISPALTKIGARVEVQPLALLRLHAQYEYFQSFGTFQQLSSFEDGDIDYSDDALKALDDAYVTGGSTLELGALLQAKVGSIAVRNDIKGHRHHLVLKEDDYYFYNRSLDVLFPNGGWAITNDADLIYLTNFGLKVGVRHTYTDVLYPDPEDNAVNTPTHRVGPAILYSFSQKPSGALYQGPTLFLLSQWWVQHRFRTGQSVSQASPYLALGIIQKGDFLP